MISCISPNVLYILVCYQKLGFLQSLARLKMDFSQITDQYKVEPPSYKFVHNPHEYYGYRWLQHIPPFQPNSSPSYLHQPI